MDSTGRGAVWLAHLHGVQGVAGSNPVAPIFSPQRHKDKALSKRRKIDGFWAATNRKNFNTNRHYNRSAGNSNNAVGISRLIQAAGGFAVRLEKLADFHPNNKLPDYLDCPDTAPMADKLPASLINSNRSSCNIAPLYLIACSLESLF